MQSPAPNTGQPLVLIASASEEQRALMMQYVAIEWPSAMIREFDSAAQGLHAIEQRCHGCDLVIVEFPGADTPDLDWLVRMRARLDSPPVVAIVDAERTLAHTLLAHGVYCHDRNWMTTAQVLSTLRAAMRERKSIHDAFEKTVAIDATATLAGRPTHPAQLPLVKPVKLRGYRLLRKLGRGGMSEVYLAQSARAGPACALKILRTDTSNPSVLDLFIEECTKVSGLDSPYIVRIHDHGVTDDCVFVAMEYIDGGDLRDRITLGLAAEHALQILLQLARALDVVHRAGIVHGDIKPQNVMFRDARSLVLVDFGVARVMETSSTAGSAQVVGTPAYISPEHVLGQPLDGRSDLYSAGVLFYEMLTGCKPFRAASVDELLRMHAEVAAPALPAKLSAYQSLLDRLLAKRPGDRFLGAKELVRYIEGAVAPATAR